MGDQTGGRQRRGRFGLWLLLSLVLLAAAGVVGLLALTGRPLPAPGWAVARVEARLDAALAGRGRVTLGAAELVVDEGFVPRVRLREVRLTNPAGATLALLPDLRVTLKPQPLLRGRIEPRSLRIDGASIVLRRDADGAFDLALGGAMLQGSAGLRDRDFAGLVGHVDEILAGPVLGGIERIEAQRLDLRLDDARSGKVWRVTDGRMAVTQDARAVDLSLGFDLASGGGAPASAVLTFTTRKHSPEAEFAATVSNVSARDLAAQSPALAWLGVVDAPISGSLRTGIDAAGALRSLDGTLELGAGAVQPTEGAKPVRFDRGRLGFTYAPQTARLAFTEVAVDGPALRLRGGATAWLKGIETGFPEAVVAQLRISDLRADPEGLFADPVVFSQGAADLKLTLQPFRLSLGQLVLIESGRRLSARGDLGADDRGWDVALDFAVDAITHERMLALWPVGLVPRTRNWIAENVATGELFDVKAALRLRPGAEPRLSLGYEFRAAEVRFLKTLPPVRDGAGYATIEGNAYTMVVDRGHVVSPAGGRIDVAGSVMRVPDIDLKPAPTRITLRTDSTITAALSLLDEPPFGFLSKAGRAVDLAEGRAEVETVLDFTLKQKLEVRDVAYSVTARLSDVVSDRLVPGRELRAVELELRADPEGIEISGPGTLSGVPFRAAWMQAFGPEAEGRSRVEGSVELSPAFAEAFRLGLPAGAVSGAGQGQIEIELARDAPARFRLTSDLNRVGLSIPELGWSKPASRTGRLEVAGTLGAPPAIERLALEAPGLSVEGRLTLRPDGGLELARFDRASFGGWFDGALELRGQGQGRPAAVAITGGSADMRRAALGGRGGGSGAGFTVALDRLQVTEAIALTGFTGSFASRGGLSGEFRARINGETAVRGAVAPGANGRSAFRILADDAGAALRSAGIFSRARVGTMDLVLHPVAGPGNYDGRLFIRNIRVKNAPVLADMLSAISVVGLLEQLSGDGILFQEVHGDFRLSPELVEVRSGSAIGASLGVSMAGVYGTASRRLDMRGVVSPVYMLNSVGQIFSRRGEGLFGFNYRMTGPSSQPQVSVNPLSILTPGLFREIFRRPPPSTAP